MDFVTSLHFPSTISQVLISLKPVEFKLDNYTNDKLLKFKILRPNFTMEIKHLTLILCLNVAYPFSEELTKNALSAIILACARQRTGAV